MAQVKIYGLKTHLDAVKEALSDTIYRFFVLQSDETLCPDEKSDRYTIIESPAPGWGFRGMTGDEIKRDYEIHA